MLKVFQYKFYRQEYIGFNKLDQYIRSALKKTFMANEIYLSIPNSYVNQHLAKFIIDYQLLVWDKIEFLDYKSIYLILKV